MFAGSPEVALPWTPAREMPRIDWAQWKAAGMTALVDAMRLGIRLIGTAKNPALVILVVSDGEETGSVTPFSELVTTRRQSETQIYAVRTDQWPVGELFTDLPGGGLPQAAPQPRVNVLPSVIGDSGGTMYTVQVEPHAPRAARAFLDDLRAQYLLGYVSSKPPDGTFRRVKVETGDKRLQVRHRGGYLARPTSR